MFRIILTTTVFLISSQLPDSKKVVEQVLTLSKLNEVAVEPTDINRFLALVNMETTKNLISLKIGIGIKTAPKVVKNRPYSTLKELQQQFGERRTLRWLRTY